MKVQLKDIMNAVPALSKLSGCDLSLKAAYKLKKLINELQLEVNFFNDERIKILKRNGLADEHLTKANQKKAEEEINELLDMEVELKSEIINLNISEDARLSVSDLESLNFFMEVVE